MTLLYDELRDAVAGRAAESRVDSSGRRLAAVSVRFSRPISQALLATISAELPHATVRLPGVIGPIAAELSPEEILAYFDALDPASLRLDTLLSSLAWSGSPLGSPLSAFVVMELCRLVQTLHQLIGADGLPRVHSEIHAGTIMIEPGGHLRLIGTGLPATSAVTIPRLTNRGDRHRLLSPEAARGEPLDPRADVYSLGVLYYELLSGHRYRDKLNPTQIAQAAIEARPPELPGALPDPRRELVHVLARALAPHRDNRYPNALALADAIGAELAASRIAPANGSLLERMVDEFVPAGVERGKYALLAVEHAPAAFEAIMSGSSDLVAPSPVKVPIDTPTAPSPPAADPWSKVLGEALDSEPPTQTDSPAPDKVPSTLSLPAPVPSSGPTRPISSDHLTAMARARTSSKPRLGPTSAKLEIEDENKHLPVRIALGIAAIALIAFIGYGLKARPSNEEPALAELAHPDAAPIPILNPVDASAIEAKPIGLLTVLSKPTGASVEIDGGFVGRTPLVMRHEFQNRGYLIKVLADGYQPWEQTSYPDTKMAINVMAVLVKVE